MTANKEPPITMTRDDYKTLSKLADLRHGAAADYLAYELDRARIVPGADQAPAAVRIGSRVRFRNLETDAEREVVVVMPYEADIEKGFVSVLTPVGVALLGLAAGQAISFTAPNGQQRSLRVVKITPPQAGHAEKSEQRRARRSNEFTRSKSNRIERN